MFPQLYTQRTGYWIFLSSWKGQLLVEYSLILGMASLVVVLVLTALGSQLNTVFFQVAAPLAAL